MEFFLKGLVSVLIKIIIMVCFVTLVYIDSICTLRLINDWKLYFRHLVEELIINEVLELQKLEITSDMRRDLEKSIVVWCPVDSFDPEFFATVFGNFYPDVKVDIKWDVHPPFSSVRASYGSVVAQFNSGEMALAAAREFAKRTRSMPVITFQLSQIMEIVVEAELRHPLLGVGSTRLLLLSRKLISGSELKREMRNLLSSCGCLTRIRFLRYPNTLLNRPVVVCEATYDYASEAYLAKFIMDGLFYKPLTDRFSATVVQTEKERYIERTLRRRLVELMDENRVVQTF